MKLLTRLLPFLLVPFIISISCNKQNNPADPCQGVHYAIQYFKTEATGGASNGSITITSPVGDTVSYSLNNGSYQANPAFSNLAAGDYQVYVKNQQGCTDTLPVTVYSYGPTYALVKQLIAGTGGIGGYCGPCHLNGGMNGGKNFDTDSSIVASWERIKIRTVDGIPGFMPQSPNSPLTPADQQKIINWVNAGHRQSD